MADRIVVDWRWTGDRRLLDYLGLASVPTQLADHVISVERLSKMIVDDDEGVNP